LKEAWGYGKKEFAPGDINSGMMDIKQRPRKQKDVQGQELWETKRSLRK